MQYTTYDYYSNNYCSGEPVVDAAVFPKLLLKSQSIIDMYTFDRLKNADISEEVQNCCCELVESINAYENRLNENPRGISSEKIKNYSVTYESAENMKRKFEDDSLNIIHRWLGRTGLLFRGC
ncbi:hypothetical protein [Eubacterium sp.]|uniref:hypothetical protein n=1 Tax=Eubacterium sp. TaxID=142586 RepID=UPI001D305AD9|nr:hypothetical protein [Eubacterium sp.]MBS5620427.1 hypothetical protein [Eubacterium sp.]MEE0716116.1 hypothetical protein [Eubacterium sp.]DAI62320.1 MAG TPA: Head Tail Connector Protein [Caudoviricetes sp.]